MLSAFIAVLMAMTTTPECDVDRAGLAGESPIPYATIPVVCAPDLPAEQLEKPLSVYQFQVPAAAEGNLAVRVAGIARACLRLQTWTRSYWQCRDTTAGMLIPARFRLPPDVKPESAAYLLVVGSPIIQPGLRILSDEQIDDSTISASLLVGVYDGILIAIALLSMIGFWVQRRLTFVATAAILVCLALCITGFIGVRLPIAAQSETVWVRIAPVFFCLAISAIAAFSRMYRKPEAWEKVYGIVGLIALLMAVDLVLYPEHFMPVGLLLMTVSLFAMVATMIATALKRHPGSEILLMALGPLVLTMALSGLGLVLGAWQGVLHGVMTLAMMAAISFPCAMAVHMYRANRRLEGEKDRAQAENTASQRLAMLRANYCRATALPLLQRLNDMFSGMAANGRLQNGKIGVFVVRADGIEELRQRFGRDAAVRLTQEFAARLRDGLDQRQLLGRIEDWDLVVVLPVDPALNDPRQRLAEAATRIRSCLAGTVRIGDSEVTVECSIGACIWPDDGIGLEELLNRCNASLYDAQQAGGNRIHFYSASLHRARHERWNLVEDLRHAIDDASLELYYHPIHSCADRRMVGAEALIRWPHPHHGLLLPDEFLPLAEEAGLMVNLGQWVVDRAIRDLAWLVEQNDDPLYLSINASPLQISDDDVLGQIPARMARSGLNCARLKVEITEDRIIENLAETSRLIRHLRDSGVETLVDDFGVGYSSLGYLRELPIAGLKIDRSFIANIGRTEQDETVLSAMLSLATGLGLTTIAEGVETVRQLRFLEDHACSFVQGFHFSEPLTREHLQQYRQRLPLARRAVAG